MIRPMRPVIVAGNWKMHTTPADAGELARTIGARTRVDGVTRVLCPPYVCLAAVRDALAGRDVPPPDGPGGDDGRGFAIAYEPVWAIGTGRNARGADAAEMAGAIRTALASLGFSNGGEDVPILYGGSVASSNIDEFMAEPAIDGALVG